MMHETPFPQIFSRRRRSHLALWTGLTAFVVLIWVALACLGHQVIGYVS